MKKYLALGLASLMLAGCQTTPEPTQLADAKNEAEDAAANERDIEQIKDIRNIRQDIRKIQRTRRVAN